MQVASYLFVCRGDRWSLMKTGQKLAIDDWWSRSHMMHKCIESHRCKILKNFCNIDATQMHFQLFTPCETFCAIIHCTHFGQSSVCN